RVLRQVNPSPYMYFLRGAEGVTVCGSSPEPMVQLLDGRVISRPIAGTRRRGRDEAADRRLAGELVEHPKERAEHVMLVDFSGNLDTAIAIRTMIVDAAGAASVSAGAGIVADSDPSDEDLECHNKARAILASAAAARNLRARPQTTEAW